MTIKDTLRVTSLQSTTLNAENPWPGLLAYREAEKKFFHGRRHESNELLRLVMREPLTVFFGMSGLGKSSLLQAGLFPRLRPQNVTPIYIRLGFSPDHPSLVKQVRQAIASETAAADVEAPAGKEDETLWEYFHRQDADFWNKRNRIILPLLVFDQFEEIFTLGRSDMDREKSSEAFLMELGDLIEGRPPAAIKEQLDAHPKDAGQFSFSRHHYKVLLSLREDWLPELEALRERIPSITHNRMRLNRMNGAAALHVVAHPQHLIERQVAEKVVRFVAAAERPDLVLEKLELEPALLSVVCRELNSKRQRLNEPRISEDLLEGGQEEILSGFYERSVADFDLGFRAFIEEQLLTVSGYRDSVALENALNIPGVTRDSIDQVVDRRLIRIEGHAGRQRLELTHDLLTGVIAASRDQRRHLEAEEQREKEIIKKERQQQLEERAKSARRFRWLSAAMTILFLFSLFAFYLAVGQRRQAEEQSKIAEQQRELAEEQRELAEQERKIAEKARAEANQRYQRITESIKLRQAVLSRDDDALKEALKRTPLETQIKFRVTAKELPYKAKNGQSTYKFQMFPVEKSIPDGFRSIALITYIMDHPTFLNPLISTGPDTKFKGTYDGVGCIGEVTAVIEYSNLDKPLAIANFKMCKIQEVTPLKR